MLNFLIHSLVSLVIMKRFSTFFLCIGLISPLLLSGQEADFVLKSFYGNASGGTIRLTWVIQGGNQCNGVRILRSQDLIHWTEVGEIGGICGSTDVDETYDYVDDSPLLNRRNYYKTELIGLGYSQIIWVDFYITNDKGYLLLQSDPEVITVIVDQKLEGPHTLQLYTLNGTLVFETISDQHQIAAHRSVLPKGVLLLRIFSQKGQYSISDKILNL
jgi:hypothetical protein